jgi:hypothetical protein
LKQAACARVAIHPHPARSWFLAVASFNAHLKLVLFDGASHTHVP